MIDRLYAAFLRNTMPPLRFPVAVIMQRIALDNRWVSERWEACAVELGDSPMPGAIDPVSASRWRCSGLEVELHPVEAEGYYLNLSARDPKVFVLWRMAEPGDEAEPRARPLIVTVSYNEAARFLDAGEQVDAVPMPSALREAMESFVAMHYKPEPRKKAKRNELYEGDERLRKVSGEGGRQ